MGSTAGSSGLGLIVGVLEGAMGDLVGVRAFPGAADHDVVSGGWVNHRIFYQILALSLVPYLKGVFLNQGVPYGEVPIGKHGGLLLQVQVLLASVQLAGSNDPVRWVLNLVLLHSCSYSK